MKDGILTFERLDDLNKKDKFLLLLKIETPN